MRNFLVKSGCIAGICALILAGCSKNNGESNVQKESGVAEETQTVAAVEVGADAESTQSDRAQKEMDAAKAVDNSHKSRVIAVSLPEASGGWMQEIAIAAQDALNRMVDENTGYILLTASDSETQARQIRSLADEGICAAVICPMDSSAPGESIVQLQKAGIPVVLFQETVDGIVPEAQVGLSQEILGQKAAQTVKSEGSSVKTVLVFSNEMSESAVTRLNAFRAAMTSDISLVTVGNTDGDAETAKTLLKQWLQDKDDDDLESVGGIFVPDEVSLCGIIEGLADYEKKSGTVFPELKIIAGCGCDDTLVSLMAEESQYPVVVYDYPAESIHTAINLALDIADGKAYEENMIIEAVKTDRDSAAKEP